MVASYSVALHACTLHDVYTLAEKRVFNEPYVSNPINTIRLQAALYFLCNEVYIIPVW